MKECKVETHNYHPRDLTENQFAQVVVAVYEQLPSDIDLPSHKLRNIVRGMPDAAGVTSIYYYWRAIEQLRRVGALVSVGGSKYIWRKAELPDNPLETITSSRTLERVIAHITKRRTEDGRADIDADWVLCALQRVRHHRGGR